MAIDYSLDEGKRWVRVTESIPFSRLFTWSILTTSKRVSGGQGISCQIRVTPIPPEAENETVDNSIQSDYNTRMENEWVANPVSDVQAGSYKDTYYIHSFDGKLLSEYDGSGNCLRDYVYMGNRLIGDYQPGDGKYHYYMSDQVNSTRVIGDDSGNVVYSEAYGPYGDLQKSFKTDYIPRLKYSGKEREADSGLDYFGARYFQNRMYRFFRLPRANEWADEKTEIPNWRILKKGEKLLPGDVAATPQTDRSGHCGFMIINKKGELSSISAHRYKVSTVRGEFEFEKKSVYRRYTGD